MAILEMNTQQFQATLAQGDKPTLVEFWAPWCVYCRRIAPAYEKTAAQRADSLTSGKVNIDDFPAIAEQYQVDTIPTFILFQGGQAVDSITAPDSKAKLDAFLDSHLGQ